MFVLSLYHQQGPERHTDTQDKLEDLIMEIMLWEFHHSIDKFFVCSVLFFTVIFIEIALKDLKAWLRKKVYEERPRAEGEQNLIVKVDFILDKHFYLPFTDFTSDSESLLTLFGLKMLLSFFFLFLFVIQTE